jgi:regulator of RNase E activity RraA
MAPSGVLMAGIALVLRDLVQRRLGVAAASLAILAGAALSALLAPPALVIASAVAFLLSEFADLAVYTPLARRGLVLAVVTSGVAGLVVDSIVFLWLAFGSLDSCPARSSARHGWCCCRSRCGVAAPARRTPRHHAGLRLSPPSKVAQRRLPRLRSAKRFVMSAAVYDTLRAITTATITTMLLKKGIRRCWMNGPKPLVADGARLVGPAFTLRFVPVREDLATPESWSKPISTRGAIEAMPEGCIAVADAMGIASAGIFGDILTMRMMKRGVTALVTDGVVRDKAGVVASKLPVWCAGAAAPASVNGLTFVGWQEPIGCGGCAIFPGDVIVCDDDGAVVIPRDLVAFVAEEGAEHERMESWIVSEVERGAKLPGLYPMNDEAKARYAAWKKK